MKIRDRLQKKLEENMLFPQEATEVLARYENSDVGESMRGRMDDDESGYPLQLMAVVWTGIKHMAVEWIDENKPKHFARSMFVD
jgi:hypothetical protein